MSKKRTVDVLDNKKSRLSDYQAQFEDAVSVVTSTINQLNEINTGIVTEIEEIEAYQKELEQTRTGLSDALAKNNSVIRNFNSLLNAE